MCVCILSTPNTNAAIDQSIINYIDLAFDTANDHIVILGDVYLNSFIANSRRKLESLCTQFSLTQCIQESTYYTENSQSILHLILVNKPESVLLCGVSKPVLERNIRCNCPVLRYLLFASQQYNHSNGICGFMTEVITMTFASIYLIQIRIYYIMTT